MIPRGSAALPGDERLAAARRRVYQRLIRAGRSELCCRAGDFSGAATPAEIGGEPAAVVDGRWSAGGVNVANREK